MKNSNLTILLVEDDKVDAMTIQRALKELKILNPVVICENGLEALNYLNNLENALPGIILLDINMPKMNGIEFLEHRKKNNAINLIPTVVLTTSKDEQDKVESFNLGVAGYMIKPVDYMQFVEVVKTINLYWTLSELPNNNR
ncbi:response regulator [Lutibacter maritimus]|jgi:CheY-like chemotaxis protein|uniref:CheY chemotaxis protein or a CheY-like REC (Receiver) domain n=1 Tax=Lutibacter maritimus TaxID=593133 RepID=A0A1I6SI91_9FLAO|nr:response regulator [Lutibacter maritimus]SFS76691.1 CheY chemotaxis protein or a CheY-like REC (receiver) domain [Lutibacter maritimus]